MDIIYFGNCIYKCQWIEIGEEIYLISTEDLEQVLLENGSYSSDEARNMDESIFFYVPNDMIELEEMALKTYIERALYIIGKGASVILRSSECFPKFRTLRVVVFCRCEFLVEHNR